VKQEFRAVSLRSTSGPTGYFVNLTLAGDSERAAKRGQIAHEQAAEPLLAVAEEWKVSELTQRSIRLRQDLAQAEADRDEIERQRRSISGSIDEHLERGQSPDKLETQLVEAGLRADALSRRIATLSRLATEAKGKARVDLQARLAAAAEREAQHFAALAQQSLDGLAEAVNDLILQCEVSGDCRDLYAHRGGQVESSARQRLLDYVASEVESVLDAK